MSGEDRVALIKELYETSAAGYLDRRFCVVACPPGISTKLSEAEALLASSSSQDARAALRILHAVRGLVGVSRYRARQVLRGVWKEQDLEAEHELSPLREPMEMMMMIPEKARAMLEKAMVPMDECRSLRYYDPPVVDMLVLYGRSYEALGFVADAHGFYRQALRSAYHNYLVGLEPRSVSRARVVAVLTRLGVESDGRRSVQELEKTVEDLLLSYGVSSVTDWPWKALVLDEVVTTKVRKSTDAMAKTFMTKDAAAIQAMCAGVYICLYECLDMVACPGSEVRNHDPLVAHILEGMATVHIRMGRPGRALVWLQRALQSAYRAYVVDKELVTRAYRIFMLCRQIGQTYLSMPDVPGRYEHAVRLLRFVSVKWPGDAKTLLYLSYGYSRLCRMGLTRSTFEAYQQSQNKRSLTPQDMRKETAVKESLSALWSPPRSADAICEK